MNDERSCATCDHYGEQDYCEDCEGKDMWNPKEESVTISVNGGPAVPFEKVEEAFSKVKAGQMDLDGNPVPDLEEDTEEEVRTFTVIRHKGVVFRISEEAYEKLVEGKLGDGPNDRKDRILRAIQNKAKITLPAGRPIDHGAWDAATEAIYKRILEREGIR